jgi:hypothetical protein
MKTYRLSRAEEILFRQKATHITALPNGRDIVDVVIGKPGPTSDKKIFDERQSAFDPQQKFQGENG